MTEYQKIRPRRHETSDEPESRPDDQRNAELDEDIACCLADIDEILTETESERDRALREFRALSRGDQRGMRIWNAMYAHLSLLAGTSCCTMYLYDNDSNKVIERK